MRDFVHRLKINIFEAIRNKQEIQRNSTEDKYEAGVKARQPRSIEKYRTLRVVPPYDANIQHKEKSKSLE